MGTFLLNAKPGTRELCRRCATAVALVGTVFSATALTLLAANHLHARTAWPTDAAELRALVETLNDSRDGEPARERLRTLDLLTRRTYFFGMEFQKRGFPLLIGGGLVALLALRARAALTERLPEPARPDLDGDADDLRAAALARRTIVGMSVFMAMAAVLGVTRLRPAAGTVAGTAGGGAAAASGAPESSSVASAPVEFVAGAWPCFRGPGGIGIAGVDHAPVRWNGATGENIVWKTPLPSAGFGSPIVWEGRVFLTAGDRDRRSVQCFDLSNGDRLWETTIATVLSAERMPDIPRETGYAAPTMAAAGPHVFAIFGTGDLAALTVDGAIAWSRHLGVPRSLYGYASSPVAEEGRVFVQYDCDSDPRLIALDAATGRTLWEARREVMPSWASPALIDAGGVRQIVLCANPFIAGYDPATGAERWRTEGMGGEPAPSPAYAGGMVYAACDASVVMAIDTALPEKAVWRARENLPDVSSPLATRERLYMASSAGIVTCFERVTGTVLWERAFDSGFYASPILVGGAIYLTDIDGRTYVFEDADAYGERAVSPLGEGAYATPAFVPGRILLRGQAHLFCVGEP